MEKLLRTALIAACFVIIGEKAARADFEVSHRSDGLGGVVSTYREISSHDAGGPGVVQIPRGFKALPNICDLTGRGPAFEIVTRRPGETDCVGRR